MATATPTDGATTRVRARVDAVRRARRPLLQSGLGVCAAWFIAHDLIGHAQPVFAPVATIVSIGAAIGQPWRRAVDLVLGVAIGITVADAIAALIGHGALQVGVLVVLATAVALAIDGTPIFVTQAGVSAALVGSLPANGGFGSLHRLEDTLVGTGVALLVAVVVLPVNPVRLIRAAAAPLLAHVAATIEEAAAAMAMADPVAADLAVQHARDASDQWPELHDAVAVGVGTVRYAPARRSHGDVVDNYGRIATQVDLAIRNVRVLLRIGRRVVEVAPGVAPDLAPTLRAIAEGVRALDEVLAGTAGSVERVRGSALRAVQLARSSTDVEPFTMHAQFIGQVRLVAVDLLRASGMTRTDALAVLLDATS